ncbi:MAG: GNAT family N-acetyltransferase [Bacteroidetes bacterium]|nr:GNAT family N-acetyltransferase [Bacteroidota bacterium]
MIQPIYSAVPSPESVSRVYLRDPTPADAQAMHDWRREEAVVEHQPLIYLNPDQIRADLEKLTTNTLPDYSKDRFQWIIERKETNDAIGWMTLSIRTWEHLIGEIGYSVSQKHHQKGYGTEALQMMLRKVFLEAGLYRVEAKCAVDNVASARLLEKVGFQKEGTLREYFNIRGRRCDHFMYSVLRHEYFGRIRR